MKTDFLADSTTVARLSCQGPVFVLTLCNGENRFNTATVRAITDALDEVESVWKKGGHGEAALVTTGEGKYYSNGIDFPAFKEQNFLDGVFHNFLKRFMTFPMPTVACLNGHAFAGGALLFFCHDYAVMRRDRGFICMNEVLLPAPVTPGMAAVVRRKIKHPSVLRNCLLEAYRFNAEEALKLGMVDEVGAENELLGKAVELAQKKATFANAGAVFGFLKREMSNEAYALLDQGGLGLAKAFKL